MKVLASKLYLAAMLVGVVVPGAAGCSMLLADPGGYYLADGAPPVVEPEAASDGSEADTGSSPDDGPNDTGSVADADPNADTGTDANPADVAGSDGSKCQAAQIEQPTNNASVSSPVLLLTSWAPCMRAIDCYADGTQTIVGQASSAPGVATYVNLTPGDHFFACSTFFLAGSGGQAGPVTVHVVAGDAAAD
jgi:hypothetical protein